MFKKLLLLAALLWATPSAAQQVQCPMRPAGDNSNACASTKWVNTYGGGGGGGAVSSVSDSGSGTMTVSPNTGAVGVGINLGNANVWTATQTFPAASLTLSELANGALGSGITVNNANWSGTALAQSNLATGTFASGFKVNNANWSGTALALANLAAGALPSGVTVNNSNWSGTALSLSNLAATLSGNTTTLATTSGAPFVNGDCWSTDSNGNAVDSGAPCGGGTGSGTVNAGTAGQIAYYVTSTNAVSGHATNATVLGALGTAPTGSGGFVLATSPTLVTPALGTISSGNIAAATGAVPGIFSGATGTPSSTTFYRGDNSWQAITSAVTGVTNSDGTLTISPTSGAVVASLALGHANTWTAAQTHNDGDFLLAGSSSGSMTLKAPPVASTYVDTFPAATTTIAGLSVPETWSASQSFNNGDLLLKGSSSGSMTLEAPAVASTYIMTFPAATDTVAVLGTNQTFTATETFAGSSSVDAANFTNATEVANVTSAVLSGSTAATLYPSTSSIYYYTANPTAAFTVNLTWSAGTSMNTALATGQAITMALLVTNGATPYLPSAYQIDGTGITPKWQGGSAPSAADASSIDSYTFTIIKTGSATYTLLAGITQFK